MSELSKDDVIALARVAGIDLRDPDLTEVAHHINAVLAAMESIDVPEADDIEPMPMPAGWPTGPSGQ